MAGRNATPDAPEAPEVEAEVNSHVSIVTTAKEMLVARLKEIQPIVDEANEIMVGLAGLDGQVVSAPISAPTPRPRRQPASGDGTPSGKRNEEFLSIIRAHPEGIKVAAIAKEMGLNSPNYLYRLRDTGVSQGVIAKDESGSLTLV